MKIRNTHTYALMEVSDPTFNEIEGKLREAGEPYTDMLEIEHRVDGDVADGIAMQGIMLVRRRQEQSSSEQRTIVETLESMGVPKELIALPEIGIDPGASSGDTSVMCPGFIDPQEHEPLGQVMCPGVIDPQAETGIQEIPSVPCHVVKMDAEELLSIVGAKGEKDGR